MSIAIEAAELMELFQWTDNDEATTLAGAGPHRERLSEELADVLIYCLTLANALDLDVSTIIKHKLEANGRKYPVTS
jgi:dCTP diphosphatase